MLHLRLAVPADRTDEVAGGLEKDDRVTCVVVMPGVVRRPADDLVTCDVTREAASDVLDWLKSLQLFEDGSVSVTVLDAAPSTDAQRAERAAPGAPDDAIVWDEVVDRAYVEARGSWSFYAFLTLAIMLASVAVVTDSSVLVIGSMVVGPEFALIAAFAVGLVLRRPELMRRSVLLLLKGFLLAIAVTVLFALLARAVGWIDVTSVNGARPLTGFIWRPDKWSVVIAVLAGCVGVLSQTSGRATALVGVFISVTTVPAAGDFAVSLAVGATEQVAGSLTQLGLNLVGMTVAGVLTLLVQRGIWRHVQRRPGGRRAGAIR